MALSFWPNGTDPQITRSLSYLDFTQDFTIFQWFRWGAGKSPDTDLKPARVVRAFLWGDNDYTPTYFVATNNTANQNDFIAKFYDGTNTFASTPQTLVWGRWYWMAVTYDVSATELKFYLDDALTDTVSANLATFAGNAPTTDFIGDDGSQQSMVGGAYERSWQRVLTFTELQTESQYARAQLRTNLLTDTPLDSPTDLVDRSGNSHSWTAPAGGSDVRAASGPFNAPGWALRATSAVATGTTSLSISKPTGTVDNDIMVMSLAHAGSGFATVPAGWTLIQRGVSGSIRGEMYWKRAASEGASYSITGLATVARGIISSYSGGLAVGNVVAASSIGLESGGNKNGTTGITPTVPNSLLVGCLASDANDGTGVQLINANSSITLASALLTNVDLGITRLIDRGSSATTGATLATGSAVKNIPEATNDWFATTLLSGNITGSHVTIVAALIPAVTTLATTDTYYFGMQSPETRLDGPLVNTTWESELSAPQAYGTSRLTWLATRSKVEAGQRQLSSLTRNSDTDADILYGRWLIGPLCAQTLSSANLDVLVQVAADRNDTSTGNPIPTAKYRGYLYVTQGASLTERTALADFTDSATWVGTSTAQFQALAAPVSVSGAIQDGDYLCLEWGVQVHVPSAYPTPISRPPTQYALMKMSRGGTESAINPTLASTGLQDGTAASTSTLAPFFTLSQELAFKTPDEAPVTNITYDTATVIDLLPYSTTVKTRRVPTGSRRQWFTWTADTTDRVFFHAFGSNQRVELKVYDGVPNTAQSAHRVTSDNRQTITSHAYVAIDAVQGTTYYILVRQIQDTVNAPSSPGALTFSGFKKQPLANNDVLVASGQFVARYTSAGVLADMTGDFGSLALSGLAIDYTERPMDDLKGGTHSAHRLYVGVFGTDIVEILDLATLNLGEQEIDFIADPLDADNTNLSSLALNEDGQLVVGYFGDGFTRVADSSHSYMQEVASSLSATFNVLDAAHADNQAGAPFAAATVRSAAYQVGGTNYLEYAPDGETVFYTSSGWYVPIGGQTVKRYNVSTGVQGVDFATLTADTNVNPGVRGLFPLADGGCLVCNGGTVVRLSSAGAVLTTYTPSLTNQTLWLTDVELDSSGTAFWALDGESIALFKFDLATGTQLAAVQTDLVVGTATSLVVYRAESATPTALPIDVSRQWKLLRFDLKTRREETA